MFNTPILFIIFNRPDTTQKVFDAIKQQKPKYLFVAADGPRPDKPDEKEKCKATRAIIEQVDWGCNLKTLFRDENRGCGKGPSEAITWFFDNVEEGIILEDDCLPHCEFFLYCKDLLKHYRTNQKISFIGGTNFSDKKPYNLDSYHFSSGFQSTWGWATWKRSWQNFNYTLANISERNAHKFFKKYFPAAKQLLYWKEIFREVKAHQYQNSCWDYQFYFSCWQNNQLAIIPASNLVSNIGTDEDATHTVNGPSNLFHTRTSKIFPLKHPNVIEHNKKKDYYFLKNFIIPNEYGLKGILRIPFRLNRKIKYKLVIKTSWRNHLAKIKSEIKSRHYWKKQGEVLKRLIIEDSINNKSLSPEEKEVVSFLKKNPIQMLPYRFTKNYSANNVKVFFDKEKGLNYVNVDSKRLYYRQDWGKKKIKQYHANLMAEQDENSPHKYTGTNFYISPGEVLVDAGAAEGIFGLLNIDILEKLYLFEPDQQWIQALKETFSPWSNKVVFNKKFISSENSKTHVSLDNYFANKKIDFLKIDVEGWESAVLEGSKTILKEQKKLKIAIATYHNCHDETELKETLCNFNFKVKYTNGYVIYHYHNSFERPFLRKCLIRAEK